MDLTLLFFGLGMLVLCLVAVEGLEHLCKLLNLCLGILLCQVAGGDALLAC